MTNKERIKTIKMSGEKCSFGSKSILDCHCDDCHSHIIEYLGKKKGKVYKYTGKHTASYLHNQRVFIERFSTDEDEITNSCEAFICLYKGSGGQCEWIPRNEIIENLIS